MARLEVELPLQSIERGKLIDKHSADKPELLAQVRPVMGSCSQCGQAAGQ